MRVAVGKEWLMEKEVWTSPGGTYTVITFTPDGYDENETREERAERLGLDLSVFQIEDNETPEEKKQRIAQALAENKKLFEEQGWNWEPTPEERAELDALREHLGIPRWNGEPESG